VVPHLLFFPRSASAALFILCGLLVSTNHAHAEKILYTAPGTGPDKWASIWYLETQAAKELQVKIGSDEALIGKQANELIDVESALLKRTGSSTTYSAIRQAYPSQSPIATVVGKLIQEIEISAWSGDVSLESRIVEQGFRNMQLRYGRDKVSKACYLDFFDNVAVHIKADDLADINSPDSLIPNEACLSGSQSNRGVAKSIYVQLLPLNDVLGMISRGSGTVFLDTRETWEYEEGHIPGAINMKLREINSQTVNQLRTANTVIAYCVKDFRGYEAARKLRTLGINAAIMTPHGMRGWIEAQLPVAGSRGVSESQGASELQRIADYTASIGNR